MAISHGRSSDLPFNQLAGYPEEQMIRRMAWIGIQRIRLNRWWGNGTTLKIRVVMSKERPEMKLQWKEMNFA